MLLSESFYYLDDYLNVLDTTWCPIPALYGLGPFSLYSAAMDIVCISAL